MRHSRRARCCNICNWYVAVGIASMTIGGCLDSADQIDQQSVSSTPSVVPGVAASTGANPPAINTASAYSLTVGDEKTLSNWIDGHRGNVILIDFWATWCAPCVSQFPHTVQLSEEYRHQGLTVFAVSMDEPESEQQVRDFLQAQKANFANLLTPYGAGSQFPEAFEIRGDVPFYKLYDRQGRLRFVFSDQPDGLQDGEAIAQIDRRVAELLAERVE